MLEKFTQDNRAENIRRWLKEIDLESADILQTERSIYIALTKANRKNYWLATPVAPFAEPVDLNALVGDLFISTQNEISYNISRIDNVYNWLSETNNVLKSELDSVEKAVTQATDDIQDISIVVGDENRNFFWVSDSFNSTSFVDLEKSTALVDTDYGMALLGPSELQAITDFEAVIDREVTNGIPGANLYIINPGTRGIADKEPEPVLERADTRNFGSLFDSDPSTWFEVERNFIATTQKVKFQGRALIFTESGESRNIQEVTKNLDWSTIIEWPDGWVDAGPDGKGVSLVEWRNLETESPVLANATQGSKLSPDVYFAFDIYLKNPTSLSSIKLLPFNREDSSPIVVHTIEVVADGNTIPIARDTELGTNRSTTKLQREVLRRTGVQLTGSLFGIPTDRDITKIRIVLTSKPAPVKHGLAHIFSDVLTEFRTERNHVLWRSVDKWQEWSRKSYNENIPKITSNYSRPAIIGALSGAANATYILGKVLNSGSTLQGASKVLGLGSKALGGVGTWLGKAVPIIGAVLALDQLVGGFFSVEKSSQVLQTRTGYDVFKGYRSAIGVRDLTLVKTKYQTESIVQSVKREFPGLVNKVGLFVDEHVPEHWGPGDWLTYYVSVDGIEWKSIPKLTDSTLEKSLVLSTPTKTIFFRAVIKGNPLDPYHSPQVRHYSLQGLPSD